MLHTAEVDLSALTENLRSALAVDPDASAALDVRGDAYGMGLSAVVRCASQLGVSTFIAAESQRAQVQDAAGPSIHLTTGDVGVRCLPSHRVYGFVAGSRAVMSVRAAVIASKKLAAGDGVSYGHTFIAPTDTRTALIAVGYGEGVARCAGGRARVRLAGADRPIIGRVAMNAAVVDTGEDVVPVGAWATLFGDPDAGHPGIASWAQSIGSSPAEVAVTFGNHIVRQYRGKA